MVEHYVIMDEYDTDGMVVGEESTGRAKFRKVVTQHVVIECTVEADSEEEAERICEEEVSKVRMY